MVDHASCPRVRLTGLALLPITKSDKFNIYRRSSMTSKAGLTSAEYGYQNGRYNSDSDNNEDDDDENNDFILSDYGTNNDAGSDARSHLYNSFLLQQTSLGDVFAQPLRIGYNSERLSDGIECNTVDDTIRYHGDTIQLQ